MGLLDRFRVFAGDEGSSPPAPEAAALRLIDEGNTLEDDGRLTEALQRYDAALRLAPDLTRAHLNRGNALLAMGDADGAVRAYADALALDPEYAPAHYNLGNALVRVGRVESAVVSYRSAISLRADFADAEVALGAALEGLGRLDDAVASYRRALAINPDYTEVHISLGNTLKSMGRLEEAVASYRQALAIDPNLAEAHNEAGLVQQQLGLWDEALASFRSALAINPEFVEAHSNAGNVELRRGRVHQALACQRRALEIKPDFAEAHSNLANALRDGGWPMEAIASYRRAIALKPDFAHAHVGLGDLFKDVGQLGDAAASFRRALQIDPQFQEAYTSLLFCLSHDESIDPATLFVEHCGFGDRFEAPHRPSWPVHQNVRDPGRRLKIGFVSGDLRAHPIAYFIEPLLKHLAGYPTLSLYAYSNHAEHDAVSERLRQHFERWQSVAGLSDASLANQIVDDGIDVLIDLSGHTSKNRLRTFARKPAPIQASWMGYPGTTGLRGMDYYFTDAHFLPIAEFGGQFTEKLVHLPASAPFLPEAGAPPVNALPALSNGYVTFGSFNRPSKLRPSIVALWSPLLRALPDARMVLGAMPQTGQYGQIVEWFAAEGIARDRLEFHARCDPANYLALYHRVDLCLDTFPYTGGTTTAHALWMGVPTLSIAGQTPASRQGAAILGQVGLDAFLARDAADFERKGLFWAGELDALARLRAELRERFDRSVYGRPVLIAAGLERAVRTMWQRWCAGLPAESFEVSPPFAQARNP